MVRVGEQNVIQGKSHQKPKFKGEVIRNTRFFFLFTKSVQDPYRSNSVSFVQENVLI